MDLILEFAIQGVQMMLVLALAPLLLGFTRKVKARLLRRQGPPLLPQEDRARKTTRPAAPAHIPAGSGEGPPPCC